MSTPFEFDRAKLSRYEIDLENGEAKRTLVVEGMNLADAKARARRHMAMRSREGGWVAVGGRVTDKPLVRG